MPGYEDLRRKHRADARAMLPSMLDRVDWPAERTAAHRLAALTQLLAVAERGSPWHRNRLAGLQPAGLQLAGPGRELEEADILALLPVMTKDDLMDNFDEIVTDPRLGLDVVEAHLETLTTDAYLFDRYHACASGGSSGRRGVFVYDWDEWTTTYWSAFRHEARARLREPRLAAAPARPAMVAAQTATHMSSSHAQTFSNPEDWSRFPVTLPLGAIVAGLNSLRPTLLVGYPSVLHGLAGEARRGRLRIQPLQILCVAEPLLPEIREALEGTWGVPVGNAWGLSEAGMAGASCGFGPWLHLSDDLCIIEPIDLRGRPVPVGERSERILLTNLFNHTLPLIRYEVTDQITLMAGACRCGSGHQRIEDPQGRLDDSFSYGDLVVHAHVFRSALGRRRQVVEYQVRQTAAGAAVAIHCLEPLEPQELAGLRVELAEALAKLGLRHPQVEIDSVDHLPRQHAGKLKRFVALPK
ncbi:MAG: phenylacetate--CoA ligase family protein [Acidimicrobiia bacterium]